MKKDLLSKPVDPLDENFVSPEDSGAEASAGIKKRLFIGIGAAVLICAIAVALPSLLEAVAPPEEPPAAVSEQPQNSAVPAGNSELSVVAYAAEWKETVLQPDVTLELNEYSPAQSDVPGMPFIVTADSQDLSKDSIRIDVNAGTLITWGAPDYTAKQRGSTYVLSSGDTIYWSPLDDQGAPIARCDMTVTAYDSDNQAHAVSVLISQTSDFNYTAELK